MKKLSLLVASALCGTSLSAAYLHCTSNTNATGGNQQIQDFTYFKTTSGYTAMTGAVYKDLIFPVLQTSISDYSNGFRIGSNSLVKTTQTFDLSKLSGNSLELKFNGSQVMHTDKVHTQFAFHFNFGNINSYCKKTGQSSSCSLNLVVPKRYTHLQVKNGGAHNRDDDYFREIQNTAYQCWMQSHKSNSSLRAIIETEDNLGVLNPAGVSNIGSGNKSVGNGCYVTHDDTKNDIAKSLSWGNISGDYGGSDYYKTINFTKTASGFTFDGGDLVLVIEPFGALDSETSFGVFDPMGDSGVILNGAHAKCLGTITPPPEEVVEVEVDGLLKIIEKPFVVTDTSNLTSVTFKDGNNKIANVEIFVSKNKNCKFKDNSCGQTLTSSSGSYQIPDSFKGSKTEPLYVSVVVKNDKTANYTNMKYIAIYKEGSTTTEVGTKYTLRPAGILLNPKTSSSCKMGGVDCANLSVEAYPVANHEYKYGVKDHDIAISQNFVAVDAKNKIVEQYSAEVGSNSDIIKFRSMINQIETNKNIYILDEDNVTMPNTKASFKKGYGYLYTNAGVNEADRSLFFNNVGETFVTLIDFESYKKGSKSNPNGSCIVGSYNNIENSAGMVGCGIALFPADTDLEKDQMTINGSTKPIDFSSLTMGSEYYTFNPYTLLVTHGMVDKKVNMTYFDNLVGETDDQAAKLYFQLTAVDENNNPLSLYTGGTRLLIDGSKKEGLANDFGVKYSIDLNKQAKMDSSNSIQIWPVVDPIYNLSFQELVKDCGAKKVVCDTDYFLNENKDKALPKTLNFTVQDDAFVVGGYALINFDFNLGREPDDPKNPIVYNSNEISVNSIEKLSSSDVNFPGNEKNGVMIDIVTGGDLTSVPGTEKAHFYYGKFYIPALTEFPRSSNAVITGEVSSVYALYCNVDCDNPEFSAIDTKYPASSIYVGTTPELKDYYLNQKFKESKFSGEYDFYALVPDNKRKELSMNVVVPIDASKMGSEVIQLAYSGKEDYTYDLTANPKDENGDSALDYLVGSTAKAIGYEPWKVRFLKGKNEGTWRGYGTQGTVHGENSDKKNQSANSLERTR